MGAQRTQWAISEGVELRFLEDAVGYQRERARTKVGGNTEVAADN